MILRRKSKYLTTHGEEDEDEDEEDEQKTGEAVFVVGNGRLAS